MKTIATALLAWFDDHGRKNLPWQSNLTPYTVWLSEIMLQQTQVDTVIPYFERFVERFPSLSDLASAKIDEVLHLWTGLGYYARARNLHRCAQLIEDQFAGEFPNDPAELTKLPGIGPSTAAAIGSIAFNKPCAILDGNVKRVLARYYGISGWPGKKSVEQKLWQHAEVNMPHHRCRDYTQAIMDFGATLCTRHKPYCERCSISDTCVALKEQAIASYPGKKPKKTSPIKSTIMLIMQDNSGKILLQRRPPSGIWGGLWSLPEIDEESKIEQHVNTRFGKVLKMEKLSELRHVFSHFKLDIHAFWVQLQPNTHQIAELSASIWYDPRSPEELGLAAPVVKLLQKVEQRA